MGSPVKAREWEKSLTVKCRLCGGTRCKRCSESAALAKSDSPVRGLHADWIADCALAMMRPSTRLMNEYQIAEQFHKLNITAVFNLTLPGEHPYCGDGLGPSGFPYDPEMDLMAENIRFYNFGWEDMTTPTLCFMTDIVKVIASVLLTGHDKVAVHCHAGYGRTGITIACALIFLHNLPPEQAIQLVRRDRPGSVQTAGQMQFVHDFYAYLNAAPIVFAIPKVHERFTIAETVEQQNRRLHGERGVNSNLPRVLDFLCAGVERAIEAAPNVKVIAAAFVNHLCVRQQTRTSEDTKNSDRASICETAEMIERQRQFIASVVNDYHIGSNGVAFRAFEKSDAATREHLFPIKVGFNVGEWNWEHALSFYSNVSIYAILLLDWIEHLREPMLDSQHVETLLLNASSVKFMSLPKASSWEKSATLLRSESESETHISSSNVIGKIDQFQGLHHLPVYITKSLDRVLSCLRIFKTNLEQYDSGVVLFDAVCARTAMALFHLSTTSCSTSSLRHHADCVATLIDKWYAPKRLELNLESLHRLNTTTLPAFHFTQSTTSIEYNPPSIGPLSTLNNYSAKPDLPRKLSALSPPLSPTQTPREPSSPANALPSSFKDVIPDPITELSPTDLPKLQPSLISPADANVRPSTSSCNAILASSPRLSVSSTTELDSLTTTFGRHDKEKAECNVLVPQLPLASPSLRKIGLSPLPSQAVFNREFDVPDDDCAVLRTTELTCGVHLKNFVLPGIRDEGQCSKIASDSVYDDHQ